MLFAYTYRSSDGERHTAEIEAESRDAAFARLREEFGIRPIKVVRTAGDETARTEPRPPRRVSRLAALILAAAAAAGVWLWMARDEGTSGAIRGTRRADANDGSMRLVAHPLPRQAIPGDRARIEGAAKRIFNYDAERFLARYAEPGRLGEASTSMKSENVAPLASGGELPSEDEFRECLERPIMVAPDDFTEWIDLKRIVAGMKREMKAYLAAGGTAREYCSELAKRQKLEASYRSRAEDRLTELIEGTVAERDGKAASESRVKNGFAKAYAYWLKANAQLESMGIWPLPLPDALRAYQMDLDIED